MALVRGLTKRIGKKEHDDSTSQNRAPTRGFSTRRFAVTAQSFDRNKISLPLELLSSSNALAYDAPDIHASQRLQAINTATINTAPSGNVPVTPASTASSINSYRESLGSPGMSSASSVTSQEASRESSPATVGPNHPTASFLEKEPTSSRSKTVRETQHSQYSQDSHRSQQHSHLSELSQLPTPPPPSSSQPSQPSQLPPPSQVSQLPPPTQIATTAESTDNDTPKVPQRALSHTKRTHQALSRQRSKTRALSPPSRPGGPSTRSSVDMFSHKPEADHPFGAELQKVNELAEEFAMGNHEILDEESQYQVDHGFQRFSVEDYISEIQPLWDIAFGEPVTAPSTWL